MSIEYGHLSQFQIPLTHCRFCLDDTKTYLIILGDIGFVRRKSRYILSHCLILLGRKLRPREGKWSPRSDGHWEARIGAMPLNNSTPFRLPQSPTQYCFLKRAETGDLAWLSGNGRSNSTSIHILLAASMRTQALRSFRDSCISSPGKPWDGQDPHPQLGQMASLARLVWPPVLQAEQEPAGCWKAEYAETAEWENGSPPVAGGTDSFVPPKNSVQI